MSSLSAAVETLAREGDAFLFDAPEEWSQGRTLYGGMTAAIAFETVKRSYNELAPLRSAQLTFIGPASGRLRFTSTLLRRGRSSTLIAADCFNDEGPAARAAFVFGAARESKVAHDFALKPDVASAEVCPPFRKEGGATRPGFWNNFETRLAAGSCLLEPDAARAEFWVWTRFLDAGDADPTTAMLALADCLPPAAMVRFPRPAPISTMTWTIDVARTPPSVDGWFLLSSSSEYAADGYSLQNMAMWSATGDLIALGRQTVAIFA